MRHYKQLWTVTDSCGNTTYDSISIHVRPLPKITQITKPYQTIIYGNTITEVWIYHQYSDLSITGLSGIGLDSLGCSVEHKKDQNNEYDRVYGDPEFAVSNATFLVTATSHQGWGCSIDSSTFSITVEQRPIDITATNATKKYDGTPLTSNNYTCTTNDNKPALVHDDVISRLSFSGSQTNVGSCENTPGNAKITAPNDTTIDKTSNYSIDYYPGTLTVTVNDTLIKVIPGSASKVYDGLPLTKNEHEDFTVTGVPDGLTWTATADGTVTNVTPGAGEKAVNEVTSFHIFDAGGNDVTEYFTNINTDSTGTLTIMPKSLTITAGDSSKVYDGSFLTKNSYTHTDLAAGDSLWSVTITGKNALVGESSNVPSDAVIKNAAGDTVTNSYNIHYVNGTLRIKVKALTITTRDSSKVYDGTELICHTYTCTGLCATDSIKDVEMLSKITYAGTIDNVIGSVDIVNHNNISIAGKDTDVTNCYQIQYIYGKLAVAKKDLTITADSDTKMYDGIALKKKSYTHSELVPGDSITTIIITGSQTVAGSSYNVPEGARIDNNNDPVTGSYNITYVNGTLTVTKKPLTITASDSIKKYDGTTLYGQNIFCPYTHTPLVAGDSIWSVTVTGSQTLVGTSNNVPSAAVIKNDTLLDITACYDITYANGTLKVIQNDTAIKVIPAGGNKTYDGSPLTKTAHNDFTVTGVPAGFTWTAKADGTVTNVHPGAGEKPENAVSDFQILNAAGDTVTGYFSKINTSAVDTLKITPIPATITVQNADKTYGQSDPTFTGTVTELINANDLGEITYFRANADVNAVGTYTHVLTTHYTANSNYTVTVDSADFTIHPKAVTLTALDSTKTYDGTELTQSRFTTTALEPGDSHTFSVVMTDASTITDVGSQPNVIGSVDDVPVSTESATAVGNYLVTIASGTLTVNCRNLNSPTTWPDNIINQNNCFSDADTTGLKDASEIQTLYAESNQVATDEILVKMKDTPTKTDNCDWEWTRTYTIAITGGCDSVKKTMSVSGSNRNKPSFTVPATAAVCPDINGSYNIDPTVTGNVSNVSDDCHSEAQLSIDYSDSEPELLPNGRRQVIRTWTVTDACGNDSSQTQIISINPLVELDLNNPTQTIILGDNIEQVHVSYNYADLSYSTLPDGLSYNSSTNILSGIPTEVGDYTVTFTAASDQTPSCGSKQETVNITVLRIQAPVVVTSDSAVKFYDGLPLVSHHYTVTLGQDTIPADDATGLLFTLPYGDKITVTPNPESTLTNAGSIDNLFSCVLENPHHYESFSEQYGKLIINRATLSMELDTARTYDGHPFVVTADHLHITGLAATDIITSGTITTDGYSAGTYVCEEGGFNAFMENGVAIKSDFAINNGLSNYTPVFNVTLRILPITEGFECPDDLLFVLTEGTSDTMVTLPASATLTPSVERTVISNNLESLNPLPAGTHTIVWILSDDLGNAMTSCEQTVTVEYTPCVGVTYHDHFYDAVRIGSQCWLTENLRNSQTSNNDAIANYHAYKDDEENLQKFGYLYSWYSAMNIGENDNTASLSYAIGDNGQLYVQGICPNGWAVGSSEDFHILFTTVGDISLLKDANNGYWMPGDGGETPNSGFNARANGWFNYEKHRYEDLLTGSHFWISGNNAENSFNSVVFQYYEGLFQKQLKNSLQGVRCIRKVAP